MLSVGRETWLAQRIHSPSLCGREVIGALRLLQKINFAEVEDRVSELKTMFGELFRPGIGQMEGPPVHLHRRKDARPRFFKARSLPHALRDKVSAEVDRLCQEGILSPVAHSEWATPIVLVMKKDGSVRICGDLKSH